MLTAISSTIGCLGYFFRARNGTFLQKAALLARVRRNLRRVPSLTNFREQLVILATLLDLPSSIAGVVVECGAFQGGTTVNLSLACRMLGRQLYVFDSFAGLPEASPEDSRHTLLASSEAHLYAAGAFACSKKSVEAAIARWGASEVCTLVPGYFEHTLPHFCQPTAFVYSDVDLRASEETCLRYLWPQLQDGCHFFTHEASHSEIASVFYDSAFWNGKPPGLVGAGSGLGLYPNGQGFLGSAIGYTVKNPAALRESIYGAA
ncbi:MAG: TylF/MycF/NovP-related O-methyltransferase [Candidatus Sulfotelmatobacter sp.]